MFAGISIALIGLVMAGGAFWPEISERYKRQLTGVIVGVVLVTLASTIVGAFGG